MFAELESLLLAEAASPAAAEGCGEEKKEKLEKGGICMRSRKNTLLQATPGLICMCRCVAGASGLWRGKCRADGQRFIC